MNNAALQLHRNDLSQLAQNISPQERYLSKRRCSPDRNMIPFKKARHPSEIKNYEFTLSRMRERALQQERERYEVASRANDTNLPANFETTPPNRSYDQMSPREQAAILNHQSQTLSPSVNIAHMEALHHQQIEIARSAIPSDAQLSMPQLLGPEHLIHPGYTAGQFGILQWHTSQLAKTFFTPNAVNRMLQQLNASGVEDQLGRSYDCEGAAEEQMVQSAVDQKDQPGANHVYDNLECGSTSDECESGGEESDDVRDEFYLDTGGRLQVNDGPLTFQQQLALAQMHNIRMQAANLNAQIQNAVKTAYSDVRNAQENCDASSYDRKSEQINSNNGKVNDAAHGADGKSVYCSVSCDFNCTCKLPSSNNKDSNPSSETVIKGKVESVVENSSKTNTKFTTSPIKNLTMPLNTDIVYPKA